ncbi:MAG: hypothetical protein M1833_003665 [Piccolia ochrophora]|nr:MAG: hypothetical protein M1833_003665 [Piccolia ochrophora]
MPTKQAAATLTTVPINPHSDGDASKWPAASSTFSAIHPEIYLIKLADMWMQDRGEAEKGKKYILDQLPAGFKVYDRPRTNQIVRDKYLFGHPRGKVFDSPAKFYPHFKYLMEDDEPTASDCACQGCKGGGQQRDWSHARANKKHKRVEAGKALDLLLPKDSEGSPKIFENLVRKLAKQLHLDEPITEPSSMDWRVNRELVPPLINETAQQRSFIPRKGELVLFCRDLEGSLDFDAGTQQYQIYDDKQRRFTGVPLWEAGVITQVAEELVRLEDLTKTSSKKTAVNLHCFRVECFPDPNSDDKGFSKQYKYVPMHAIRPFSLWEEFLNRIPRERWHPTINHAMLIASSITLIERYRFKGHWPEATVHCKGAWLGFELILVGDAIRILPDEEDPTVTCALVVEDIKLCLVGLGSKETLRAKIRFVGRAYTTKESHAFTERPIRDDEVEAFFPSGMSRHKWWRAHNHAKAFEVSMDRVMGRCFEADALYLWLGEQPVIDYGLKGTKWARIHSAKNFRRVDKEQRWYWAENRVEQLDLDSINGIDVGHADRTRHPSMWRRMLQIMDSGDSEDMPISGKGKSPERPDGEQQPLNTLRATSDAEKDTAESSSDGEAKQRWEATIRSTYYDPEAEAETEDTIQRMIDGQILAAKSQDSYGGGDSEEDELDERASKRPRLYDTSPIVID